MNIYQLTYLEKQKRLGIKQYNFRLSEDEAAAVRNFINEVRDPAHDNYIRPRPHQRHMQPEMVPIVISAPVPTPEPVYEPAAWDPITGHWHNVGTPDYVRLKGEQNHA